MYDKVKIYCPRTGTTPDVSQYLEAGTEELDIETGEITTYGSVGGLRVGVYPSGTTIMGSLPKFLYGDNLCSLDIHSSKEVFEKISDILHLDLQDARVTELEFGANMIMLKLVEVYLGKLGSMPRLERFQYSPDTVYYTSRGKQQHKKLVFYDKGREVGKAILEKHGLGNANVLRYEMRLKGRLSHQLKVPEVLVPTLQERPFYRMLADMWHKNYTSIEKARQTTNLMSKSKTVKTAYDMFVARLINQSDQSLIADYVSELKANKYFDDRKDYSRLRQKFARISSLADFCTDDPDIVELDDGIRNATAYL